MLTLVLGQESDSGWTLDLRFPPGANAAVAGRLSGDENAV